MENKYCWKSIQSHSVVQAFLLITIHPCQYNIWIQNKQFFSSSLVFRLQYFTIFTPKNKSLQQYAQDQNQLIVHLSGKHNTKHWQPHLTFQLTTKFGQPLLCTTRSIYCMLISKFHFGRNNYSKPIKFYLVSHLGHMPLYLIIMAHIFKMQTALVSFCSTKTFCITLSLCWNGGHTRTYFLQAWVSLHSIPTSIFIQTKIFVLTCDIPMETPWSCA